MVPDFGGLIWIFIALAELIIFVGLALAFVFWFMPPIARRMIRAKWSKGSIAFIQDATGRVRLCISNKELPEGVVHNERGWFLTCRPPYMGEQEESKRGPGRPPKNPKPALMAEEEKEVTTALEAVLRVPLLDGLGKQCFFGSTGSHLLTNLEAIAHADLPIMKKVLNVVYGGTQLDSLEDFAYLEGLKVRGGDAIRLIIIIACLIALVGTIGLVIWFLKGGA